LSQSPESSAANYVLGNVFARKDRKELALEHFLKAKERESGLPPEERARLNEAIGLAYAEISKPPRGREILRERQSVLRNITKRR
jgi:hypothetical protein